MGKLLYSLSFMLIAAQLFAQGLMETPIMQVDSSANESVVELSPAYTYPLLENGTYFPLIETKTFQLPKFDFSTALFGKWQQDNSFYINRDFSSQFLFYQNSNSPFLHSGAIFNQAAYKISDKVTFGGNSFGANSIFSSPLPANGQNNYDFKGASMFIQYKVSKNIKIEAGVSVTHH